MLAAAELLFSRGDAETRRKRPIVARLAGFPEISLTEGAGRFAPKLAKVELSGAGAIARIVTLASTLIPPNPIFPFSEIDSLDVVPRKRG